MPPRTRKPTGLVPWPFILIAGEEKSGKSLTAALFSRLKGTGQIGPVYWLDLGEGSADEYAALPGVDYDVLEHDGTYRDILARVLEVNAEAERAADAKEPPVVLVIDSVGAFWKMLSLWTTNRAANNTGNKRKLAADPDAEIDVAANYWNDANDRHRRVVDVLKGMRGIVIGTARLKEVTVMQDGRPTTMKEWKADAQKDLAYDSTVTIHQHRDPRKAVIVGARSIQPGLFGKTPLDLDVPDIGQNPDSAGYLGDVVFGLLGCSIEASSQGRQYQRLDENLVDRFLADCAAETSEEGLTVLWAMAKQALPPSAERKRISDAITARLEVIRAGDAPTEAALPSTPEQDQQAEDDAVSERLRAAATEQTEQEQGAADVAEIRDAEQVALVIDAGVLPDDDGSVPPDGSQRVPADEPAPKGAAAARAALGRAARSLPRADDAHDPRTGGDDDR